MANIHCPKYEKYYDEIMRYHNEGKNVQEIVELLKSSEITNVKQVRKIIQSKRTVPSQNMLLRIKGKYRQKDLEAIQLISNGLSHTQTARLLGIDQISMTRRLKLLYDVQVLPDGKKSIDSQYFHDIDCEEKAYWLGFLFADGYIDHTNGIELSLKKHDKKHLSKFKQALHSQHTISLKTIILNDKEHYAYRLCFKDTQIANDLKSLGCINKKSKIVQMPDLNSLELYRHFLRGYCDGDGSIYIHHQCKFCMISFTTGSKYMAFAIRDFALEVLGIHMCVTMKHGTTDVFKIQTSARTESAKLLHYLYDNCSIYLDRKYKQYLTFCRLELSLQKTQDYEDGIKRGWRKVMNHN